MPDRKRSTQVDALRAKNLLGLPADQTAHATLCGWQKVALVAALVLIAGSLFRWPLTVLIVLNVAATTAYLAVVGFRLFTVHRGERESGATLTCTPEELRALGDDAGLPVYTILCPLYREGDVVARFLRAMIDLDYPSDRLDIRLLLEEDDLETQAAARKATKDLGNPDFVRIIVVPDIPPRTKPKACNYGLLGARGEYVVIFDAEDEPERDQLKRALIAFRRLPDDVVCVQAKLNYFNPQQNLLTRFFTSEYSMWFDLFLPGLFAVGSPIPLGGTSNHFKTEPLRALGAWDPFNVCEDADLGIRVARSGGRTAVIDSTTWEEANSQVGNWIRQRSRWVKGYSQVWLVSMRHPLRLLRALGVWRFLCLHMAVGGTPFVLLMNPVYWGITLLYLLTGWGFVERLFPTPVFLMSLVTALLGNLVFVYLSIYGLLKREHYGFVPLMFLSPLYWILQSIGAWKGLYQLVVKPHFWEKTTHGLTGGPTSGGVSGRTRSARRLSFLKPGHIAAVTVAAFLGIGFLISTRSAGEKPAAATTADGYGKGQFAGIIDTLKKEPTSMTESTVARSVTPVVTATLTPTATTAVTVPPSLIVAPTQISGAPPISPATIQAAPVPVRSTPTATPVPTAQIPAQLGWDWPTAATPRPATSVQQQLPSPVFSPAAPLPLLTPSLRLTPAPTLRATTTPRPQPTSTALPTRTPTPSPQSTRTATPSPQAAPTVLPDNRPNTNTVPRR